MVRPEDRYFLGCEVRLSDYMLRQLRHYPARERSDYVEKETIRQLTQHIAHALVQRNLEDAKAAAQMQSVVHFDMQQETAVQMGVYILTPKELQDLKTAWRQEWWEYERGMGQKTHSGAAGARRAYSDNPESTASETGGGGPDRRIGQICG